MARLSPLFTYSLRMAVEGTSTPRGVRPAWLARAADVRLVDYGNSNGETLLHIEAPALGQAAPELFEQARLWPQGPEPEITAVDLAGSAVEDVRAANADSMLYDRPLLIRIARLRQLLDKALKRVDVPAGINGARSVPLDRQAVTNARQLSDRTPAPQEARVVGVLDMVRYSTRTFALKMADGSEVRGVLEQAEQIESIGRLLNRKVLVLGRAVYRPSGAVLRIEARAVAEGEGQPPLFEKVPAPRRSRPPVVRFKPGEARSWLDSFFGKWPGDETDEELLATLHEIRHR